MAKPPKFCRDGDTIYGYDPVDVVRVGQEGRAGTKGTPGVAGADCGLRPGGAGYLHVARMLLGRLSSRAMHAWRFRFGHWHKN